MFANYRIEDIRRKMHVMKIRPLDVMVTGVTGAGKSTTLNCLFGSQVAKVGNGVEPETMDLNYYELNEVARFWDTPGLGDGVVKDKIHAKKIVDLLFKDYYKDDRHYGWIDLVLMLSDSAICFLVILELYRIKDFSRSFCSKDVLRVPLKSSLAL